ncbi:MAG TPA: hypothetical protein VGV35_00445, partial [Bryobacteraceae bacterium]|nr:hypothetical protein [Bryobacteraceae bacterium]
SVAPGIVLRRAHAAAIGNPDVTKVNPKSLVTAKEVHAWHAAKDSMGGPTMTGSPSWRNYLQILEKGLRDCGCVDIFHNPWTFTRWSTTEFPDDSHWSLAVEGKKIKVASYGCNSGKTPDDGVHGGLVVYQEGMPAESLRGKIAIVIKDRSAGGSRGTDDYEYLSNPETFPNPLLPRSEEGPLSPFPIMGLGAAEQALTKSGAIGALLVMPLSYDALSGVYTFGVPKLHDMPTLYIDRDTAVQLLDAAKAGKSATLRLISKTEEAEAYQLYGYLPGKDYGTPADQQVMLVTHTDGPSISQENGGLGILAMVKYFSHIPKAERPRTLIVRYDCRHYMPGAERAFAAQDYAAIHPDAHKKVIAAMGIEHLGQIQVAEGNGKPYHRTNLAELSSVWITNNQHLVDMAIQAVRDNRLKRVQVQCPGRKGIHGGEQGPWYGLGNIARTLGVPGISTMGSMTGYWSTKARMDYLDADHFVNQMATMCQLCGELMIADVSAIASPAAKPA